MADKQVLTGEDFLLQYSTDDGVTTPDIPGYRRFDPKLTRNEINTEAAGDAIATGKPGRIMTKPVLNILYDEANATALDVLEAAFLAKTSLWILWAYDTTAGQPLYGISAYVVGFEMKGEDQNEQEVQVTFLPADADWVSDPATEVTS